MHTTLRLDGANCSSCFNDVLHHLRQRAGVHHVDGSISGSWIAIDHGDDVTVDDLVRTVRPHAHGIEMFANEIRMIPLDAVDAGCAHGVVPPPS